MNGARASIVTTHGEMLDACMVVGRINQAEAWRYLQMTPCQHLHSKVQESSHVQLCSAPCYNSEKLREEVRYLLSEIAHPILAVEGPQGSHLPLLDVPCTPVIQKHHTEDLVLSLLDRDRRAQVIPQPHQSCLAQLEAVSTACQQCVGQTCKEG